MGSRCLKARIGPGLGLLPAQLFTTHDRPKADFKIEALRAEKQTKRISSSTNRLTKSHEQWNEI
jgi:hypothetical protein